MADRLDLYFRAYTIAQGAEIEEQRHGPVKQQEHALIFHCATSSDERKELLFGAYICAQVKEAQFVANEIGLFHRDGHPEETRVLERFVKGSNFELGTVEQFRRRAFLKYLKASGLIVAYDAPSEISRIAVKWNKSTKQRHAFSFYFRLFRDKRTGQLRSSGFEPGLSIESLDAAKAIYRLIKYAFHADDAERDEEEQSSDVHVLDLKTLTAVLTGEAYTFSSASEIFGTPASKARRSNLRVTKPAIERLLRDVTGELELLNRLKRELKQHPVNLVPERCYSPATLAKGYFSAMGIEPPQQKFKIPDKINGITAQAFFAGRAECLNFSEGQKPKACGRIEGGSEQCRLRPTLPDERQGLRFSFSLACFFRASGLSHSNYQGLGGAGGVLLSRNRCTCNGRVAFALRHVGASSARHGRPDCCDGHGQRNDRLNQRRRFGSMRGRPSQT